MTFFTVLTEIIKYRHKKRIIQVLPQEKEQDGEIDASFLFQTNSMLNALNFRRIKQSTILQSKNYCRTSSFIALSVFSNYMKA